MSGRGRLAIGAYGDISILRTVAGAVRSDARHFRTGMARSKAAASTELAVLRVVCRASGERF